MSVSQSFTSHSPHVSHKPIDVGMTVVRGRVYRDEHNNLYIRLPEKTCLQHHRTGKPAAITDYVGIDNRFTVDDLEIIIEDLKIIIEAKKTMVEDKVTA